mmetsp:Transcript_19272/g.43672  ORF Transcript_19272/g.43672 Transcript_19272/m.43672 type:complete len:251 (+) Transcript_19272:494-1246(+)
MRRRLRRRHPDGLHVRERPRAAGSEQGAFVPDLGDPLASFAEEQDPVPGGQAHHNNQAQDRDEENHHWGSAVGRFLLGLGLQGERRGALDRRAGWVRGADLGHDDREAAHVAERRRRVDRRVGFDAERGRGGGEGALERGLAAPGGRRVGRGELLLELGRHRAHVGRARRPHVHIVLDRELARGLEKAPPAARRREFEARHVHVARGGHEVEGGGGRRREKKLLRLPKLGHRGEPLQDGGRRRLDLEPRP